MISYLILCNIQGGFEVENNCIENRGKNFLFLQYQSNQINLAMLRPTQLTQASFLQRNQMLQNVFLIFLTLRWHSGAKNHEILTFKVNFLKKMHFLITSKLNNFCS